MLLKPAKCPECGKKIIVDPSKDAWICEHCKQPFVVEKALLTTPSGICPECKGCITVNVEKDAMICELCQEPFVVKKAIQLFDELISAGHTSSERSTTKLSGYDLLISEESIDVDNIDKRNVKRIIIDKKLKEIPFADYSKFPYLEEIIIPEGIEHIWDSVFADCRTLRAIKLPESTIDIEYGAFKNCISLTDIVIPKGAKSVGMYAFEGCRSLKKVVFAGNTKEIQTGAFKGCNRLSDIELSKGLVSLGHAVFKNCVSLENIIIPAGVKEILKGTFNGCKSLKRIEFVGKISLKETECFNGCVNLKDVNLQNVISISNELYNEFFISNIDIREQFTQGKDFRHLEYIKNISGETWYNNSLVEKEANAKAKHASKLYLEMIAEQIEKAKTQDICPFCKANSINVFGKCTNKACVSFKKTISDTVKFISERIEKGLCPSCGSKLLKLDIKEEGGLVLKCSKCEQDADI